MAAWQRFAFLRAFSSLEVSSSQDIFDKTIVSLLKLKYWIRKMQTTGKHWAISDFGPGLRSMV